MGSDAEGRTLASSKVGGRFSRRRSVLWRLFRASVAFSISSNSTPESGITCEVVRVYRRVSTITFLELTSNDACAARRSP